MNPRDRALVSAEHWEELATEADRMADWEEHRLGWGASASRHKARSYRAAAKALRMEADDGIARCSCCFKPLTARDHWKK